MRQNILSSILLILLGMMASLTIHYLTLPQIIPQANAQSSIPISQSQSAEELAAEGRSLYREGRFAESAIAWRAAADAYGKLGTTLKQAMALANLSLTSQQLGEWQSANNTISESLRLVPKTELKLLVQTLDIQGNLQLLQAKAPEALLTWKQTAEIYTHLNDEDGVKRSLINQSRGMQELGRYQEACETLTKVLKFDNQMCQFINSEVSNKIKEAIPQLSYSPVNVVALRQLGDILRIIGNLDLSLYLLENTRTLGQTTQERSETEFVFANIKRGLGNRIRELDKAASSLNTEFKFCRNFDNKIPDSTHYQEALSLYESAGNSSSSTTTRIQSRLNQLSLSIEVQAWQEYQYLLPLISEDLAKLPPSRVKDYAAINYTQSLACLQENGASNIPNWLEIRKIVENAANQAKERQDWRAKSYSFGRLGRLYEHEFNLNKDRPTKPDNQLLEEARNYTEEALILAESTKLNAPDIAYQWQWQLGRILEAQGKDKDQIIPLYTAAFNTLESLRRDLVSFNRDIQFSFRDEVEPIYRKLVDLLLRDDKSGNKSNQEKLKQARQVIEALQLAELDDFFHDACVKVKEVNIDDIVDNYDSTTAVIYPIILKDRLEVILKLPDPNKLPEQKQLLHYSTKLSQVEVEDTIKKLKKNIIEPDTAIEKEVKDLSHKLYNWLILPGKAYLEQSQIKNLVFVLDGYLRNIPMSVLYDGKQYLVNKYSTVIAPGLQLIDTKPLKPEQLEALTAGISEGRSPFPALPNVKNELKAIENQLSSRVLLDYQFTTLSFQEEAQSSPKPVIHLATHGQFSSNPDDTFIVAWDRKIFVKDLINLLQTTKDNQSNSIQLIVLSACQTADGDNRATLGLAGIAFRAGARSTIASLWNVGDDSTALLMSKFYQELVENHQTKAEALRQAQITLLQNSRYRSPRFWSPYILVGNWGYLSVKE